MPTNIQTTSVRVRHGEDRVEVIVSSDEEGVHVNVSINGEPWIEPPVAEGDGNGSAPPPGNGDGGNGGG